MLQTYLIPIEGAGLVFFFSAIVLLIPICVIHYRRFGYLRPTRAIVFYGFLFYALCAFFLTILPLPELTANFCEVRSQISHIQLKPFRFVTDIVVKDWVFLRHFNLISILESFVFLQVFFNFLLLMPLGFFLRYYFRTSFKLASLIAIATTSSFEITQITGIYGVYPCPYRFFDVDDLILNASGAMVGYLVMPLFFFLPNLQQRPKKTPQKVTLMRRLVAFIVDWFTVNTIAQIALSVLFTNLEQNPEIWIHFILYFVWFIIIPWRWNGQTLGKKLVLIRLINIKEKPISLPQLSIRYGLLIFLPTSTETFFQHLFEQQKAQLGYVDGLSSVIFLSLFALELLFLFGLMLVRSDRRGIHELLSKTQNVRTYVLTTPRR